MIKLTFILFICFINIFAKWAPDFLIIGAMKGGTTSLFNYLLEHPNIAKMEIKELHFFDFNYYRGVKYYKNQFPKKNKNQLLGEATPFYLFHPLVAKRVHKYFPKIKLIILLRDPVERAISHYFFNLNKKDPKTLNFLETLSFEEAIKQEPQKVNIEIEKLIKKEKNNLYNIQLFSYLSRGIYINQIANWLKYFSRKQILILFSEDLFKNPQLTYNKVLEFLNLPNITLENIEIYNQNPNKGEINPELRQQLISFFQSYNDQLQKFLKVNLPWKSYQPKSFSYPRSIKS